MNWFYQIELKLFFIMRISKFFIVLLLLLFSCSKVIFSNKLMFMQVNPYENNTTINAISNNFKKSETNLYSNLTLTLLNDEISINDHKIYTLSYFKNTTNLIELNLKNNKSKIISNKNESPQVKTLLNNNIYYSSNYVSNNYLIKKDLITNKEFKKEFNGYFFNYLICENDKIFAFVSENKNNKEYILQLNKNDLSIISKNYINRNSNSNSRPIIKNNTIYYVDTKNRINIYDFVKNKMSTFKLKIKDPQKLIYDKNKIYINSFNKNTMSSFEKRIEIFDLSNKKSECYQMDYFVNSFVVKDNHLFTLSNDFLVKYNITNLKKENIFKINKKRNNYTNELFLLD
ncbi:hypothetical protein OKW22_001385 [Bacilli bacterium PM5-3]|nr:hypothetical protein [Bacilli bacterium PM5-3]